MCRLAGLPVRQAGVVGSRSLPVSFAPLVSRVVSLLLARGYRVASGGALGADSFALSALLQQGVASQGVVFSAWQSSSGFPSPVQPQVAQFLASGGQVVWGLALPGQARSVVVPALLGRNRRLVSASSVLVAFLFGPARQSSPYTSRGLPRATSGSEESRGTLFTVRQAVEQGIPVVVVLCGGGASLPADLASRCLVISEKEVI